MAPASQNRARKGRARRPRSAAGSAEKARERRQLAYARIYAIVDSVPAGCVATYGQVASEAGLVRGRPAGRSRAA